MIIKGLKLRLFFYALFALQALSSNVDATVLWDEDFEVINNAFPTFDPYGRVNVNRWSYRQTPAPRSGQNFMRIELQAADRYVDPNNGQCLHNPCLIRSEMNHPVPPVDNFAALVGQERYYAFSARTRSDDFPAVASFPHQITTFECRNIFHQFMRFNLTGTKITMTTSFQGASFQTLWDSPNAFTPDVWHDFVLHVKWSANAAEGFVELWFDGAKVVNKTFGNTLCNGQTPQWSITNYFGPENPAKPTFVINYDRLRETTELSEAMLPPVVVPSPSPVPDMPDEVIVDDQTTVSGSEFSNVSEDGNSLEEVGQASSDSSLITGCNSQAPGGIIFMLLITAVLLAAIKPRDTI